MTANDFTFTHPAEICCILSDSSHIDKDQISEVLNRTRPEHHWLLSDVAKFDHCTTLEPDYKLCIGAQPPGFCQELSNSNPL